MKVLLLGSEGFVGQNLIDGLKEKHELLTADVLNSGTHTNYTKFDITNLDETYSLIKNIDVVINLVTHTLTQSFFQKYSPIISGGLKKWDLENGN